MIEKKYQFFIDTPSQNDFLIKKVSAKKPNSEDMQLIKHLPNFERLMSTVTEYTVNTQNLFFKEFCNENNISEKIYNKIVRNYNEISLSLWGLSDINDLQEHTVFSQQRGLYTTFYESKLLESKPFIIKFQDKKWLNWDKIINYGQDIVISKNILDNAQKTGMKYRIYIDDRLLIERFYPEDLPISKIICEECFLDLNKPVKISLVTDYNLIVTKAVSNNNITYPNSKEFILEP